MSRFYFGQIGKILKVCCNNNLILVTLLSKDRIIGIAILIVCVVIAVVYLLALFGYSQIFQSWLNIGSSADVRFWLIAVPVFVAFIAILIIGGWIGWTMLTTPPPKPIEEIATETEPKKEETPMTPVPPTEDASGSGEAAAPTSHAAGEMEALPIKTREAPSPAENDAPAQKS